MAGALRISLGTVAFLAGLDKFLNLLADWTTYLSPIVSRLVEPALFMRAVGVIEMADELLLLSGITWQSLSAETARRVPPYRVAFRLHCGEPELEEGTMYVIAWILFGLIVGIIAKLLMPGRDPGGFIVTILLGITGALLGGWLGRVMGFYREGQAAGWLVSIVGAIILLFIYRLVARPRRI